MKRDITYKTIDGRGEHESFRDCVTKAIEDLKPGEGIHVIKDFEPFPMYKMMEAKGFDKEVEKISDTEYHVYFYPSAALEAIKMGEFLDVDEEKIKKIVNIKLDFLNDQISLSEAKEKMNAAFDQITAQEFAICEQYLQKYGITDDTLAERMEEILKIFEDVLVSTELDLPLGHPIRTYLDETDAIKGVLKQMESLLQKKFIKNQWLEIYEKLSQINIHFSRKQNQLFAALERKGFDKPSKVMWTLDNNIKEIIKKAKTYLDENKDDVFIKLQDEVIEMVKDMMIKEIEILFPTAIELLSEEDFIEMRIGDDEIGYCLIEAPMPFGHQEVQNQTAASNDGLLKDLAAVLSKHGVLNTAPSNNEVLDVSQGKLTLEQINLIFKHLQVDLSYVDENEIVKFYSDTKHRVFPRSAGVIGRKVQNCHPRESVDTVERIIKAFRAGEQDQAEFWLEIGGKFIYIIYNAVRDEKGNFRGILEMMQDVTHIRSLTGSQRLLSWEIGHNSDEEQAEDGGKAVKLDVRSDSEDLQLVHEEIPKNAYGINKETILGHIVKEYPFIKDYLLTLSPKFAKLKNPFLFKTMSSVATLEMISERGELDVKDVIDKITREIEVQK
ncbi:PAS domain-containing protein [Cellulosilyticum sp. I15G10I2]|uniref:PAS domain-containing protein n=1 Tax=Cellulosilyticum sp. I15G10I2 TaxID=1892843 RepID=UPI000945912B|nr:PAS domain-containing protein [Cellulosilyticum sp. I15G10I2]